MREPDLMHLTMYEWQILKHTLEVPERVQDMLPLEPFEVIDAMCEDLRESREYNSRNALETRILSACIDNSDIHTDLPFAAMNYEQTMFLVDAAFSLEDRFAARFPVSPKQWFKIVGSEVDVKSISH